MAKKAAAKKRRPRGSAGRTPTIGLTQVAERAGVSIGTVSKVLNGVTEGFSVRDEVRQRIMDSVAELGYRPDLLARTLRKNSRPITGIVSPRWYCISGVYDALISSAVWRLREADMRPYMSFPTSEDGGIPIDPWMRDGVIVMQPHAVEDLESVESLNLPYVSANGPAGPGGSEVLVDDEDGTRQAMEHLFALGHRRIAFVHAPTPSGPHGPQHASAVVRAATYRDEMRARGAATVELKAPYEEFPRRVGELLKRRASTAILGYDHEVMATVMSAARDHGIGIPDDVSLVTFNDIAYMELLSPAPTVVRIPAAEMGRHAANALIRSIADRSVRDSIVLREELVVRSTTGAPR